MDGHLKQKIDLLPTGPGCYLMKDRRGETFYIGKAKNLRSRVRSYFSGSDQRRFVAFLDQMLVDIEVIVVENPKEALLLERTLVSERKPKFNVLLKDDKNFIHLKLRKSNTRDDAKKRRRYPRVEVVRNASDDGAHYFGPFHSASAVRRSLRTINRTFQLRTCTDNVLENRARPCLQYQIGRCPAPCVYDVEEYPEQVQETLLFLRGNNDELLSRLQDRMVGASEKEDFEAAARLRDQIAALRASFTKQVVTDVARRRNQDVLAAVRDAALLQFERIKVREGRMLDNDAFPFDEQEFPTDELFVSFLHQLYDEMTPEEIPDEILVNVPLNDDFTDVERLLTERRGRRVVIRNPVRGGLRRLLEIAEKNARLKLDERLRTSNTRTKALANLARRLRRSGPIRTIECFDVSLIQGTDAVASKVCFVDGTPHKPRYRRYKIRDVEGTDDFAMMHEVLTRRLQKVSESDPLPDLLLVDGGKGQLKMATLVCQELGIPTGGRHMSLASIAKSRLLKDGQTGTPDRDAGFAREQERTYERLFIPGAKDPLFLKPHTHERYLIEQVRDEAHRFAIEFHRKQRRKRTLTSELDDIPGIGPKRRARLLKTFGSLTKLKQASATDIESVDGISPILAKRIREYFHPKDAT